MKPVAKRKRWRVRTEKRMRILERVQNGGRILDVAQDENISPAQVMRILLAKETQRAKKTLREMGELEEQVRRGAGMQIGTPVVEAEVTVPEPAVDIQPVTTTVVA